MDARGGLSDSGMPLTRSFGTWTLTRSGPRSWATDRTCACEWSCGRTYPRGSCRPRSMFGAWGFFHRRFTNRAAVITDRRREVGFTRGRQTYRNHGDTMNGIGPRWPTKPNVPHLRALPSCLVLLVVALLFDAPIAHGQTEAPGWRSMITVSPSVVWEDQLNGSDFGLEFAARTLRLGDLPVPLGIGFRLAKSFAHGEALNERSTFLIAEFRPNGHPLDVEVGVFARDRRSCEGCRTDMDAGLELGVGLPLLFRMELGEFTGALSLGTRAIFGSGFSYSTVVGIGVSQTPDRW